MTSSRAELIDAFRHILTPDELEQMCHDLGWETPSHPDDAAGS